MADDEKLPPRGRFARFRRLAGFFVSQGARRLTGEASSLFGLDAAERLVSTLGDLRGMATKLGQVLSMEADLFPREVQQVLARLQNQAPAMSYATVMEVITRELGGPPEERFARFEHEAFAAASLGQVHRAWLADGRAVAVKVQYPGVEEGLHADLSSLGLLVKAVSASHPLLDARGYFEEIRRELTLELDYAREAELCRDYARAAAAFSELAVPAVIPSHSSARVLTLELLLGETLKDFMARPTDNAERFRVSCLLVRAIQGPFLTAGRVHADPHPGNFLVMPDGRLGVLDFGAVKRPSPGFVAAARAVLQAGIAGEDHDLLGLIRQAGFQVELPDEEAQPLLEGMVAIARRSLATRHYNYGTCQVVPDMRRFGAQHMGKLLKIRPPQEGLLYFRALGGLVQNLRRLGAAGDFRTLHERLLALERSSLPTPVSAPG
jgi:predicted unusual protein kinase regulating ubiquinone biosynthesis (AarF/ABC1/UbiB family)